MTSLFNLATHDKVGIIAFEAKTFAKKVEVRYITPAISKNQIKYPRSSRGKNLAKPGNE